MWTARTRLSDRLSYLLDRCLPGKDIWDLFCDHGQLGEAALRSERFGRIHFVDQVPHLMALLKQHIEETYDDVEASFYTQDARALDWSQVSGNVVMAGVGGSLIVEVLEQIARSQHHPMRFIICPNRQYDRVRQFCLAQRWGQTHIEEFHVQERGQDYEGLVLDHSS